MWQYKLLFLPKIWLWISFRFLMASAMSRAVVGSIVSLIVYIISFTPFMAIFVLETSYFVGIRIVFVRLSNLCTLKTYHFWIATSFQHLLMTTAFSFAFNYVTRYEQQSIGLQWDNFAQSPVEDDAFNCLYCCLFLIFDSILYSLLGVVILICK